MSRGQNSESRSVKQHINYLEMWQDLGTRTAWKVSVHFEIVENRSHGLDAAWQPVRGDRTVHP